jgi:hypothetical protein
MLNASLVIFLLLGLVQAALGLAYLTTNEFMPYHSQAIETDWRALNSNYQGLYLGFLKGLGSGAFIVGATVASMATSSIRHSIEPYKFLLPWVCNGYLILLSYAIYTVYTKTAGEPPLLGTLVLTLAAAIATLLLWVALTTTRTRTNQ